LTLRQRTRDASGSGAATVLAEAGADGWPAED